MLNTYSIRLYQFLILLQQPKRYMQLIEETGYPESSITFILKVLLKEQMIVKEEKEYILRKFYTYKLTEKGERILSHLRLLFGELNT